MKRAVLGILALSVSSALMAATPKFDGARISADVKELASDAYEGRSPATAGEEKTIAYLSKQFAAAGLQPGGDLQDGKRLWTQAVPLRTLDWIVEAQRRGAGEIVLNCMDCDGVRRGYDVEQLRQARALCNVPLIASGGAGAMEHFAQAFDQADVDGALAASVFHSGAIAIADLKRYLREQQIEVRDVY